jgi:hypothetical protein
MAGGDCLYWMRDGQMVGNEYMNTDAGWVLMIKPVNIGSVISSMFHEEFDCGWHVERREQ